MKYLIWGVILLIDASMFFYQMAQEIIEHHVGESILFGVLSVLTVVDILYCIHLYFQ